MQYYADDMLINIRLENKDGIQIHELLYLANCLPSSWGFDKLDTCNLFVFKIKGVI